MRAPRLAETDDPLTVAYERVMARSKRRRGGPVINGVRCRLWTGGKTGSGYGLIQIGQRCQYVHRIVNEYLHGPLEDAQVNHACDTPLCVEDAHHVRGDQLSNVLDCVSRGRHKSARLTAEDVRAIRAAAAEGTLQRELAECYGISVRGIQHVVHGRNYAWVE